LADRARQSVSGRTIPARRRAVPIAGLLFGSGLCALVYQVVWLRELRHIFGASTPASAVVLAVFMGGLGFGSLVLSKRAERSRKPLRFYAHLELLIALSALATPLLLDGVRAIYIGLGGSTVLGQLGGTLIRLALSALVLLVPTFLMGGTLPAAARAATPADDTARTATALLYGLNTLGAVAGAALSTFFLLEALGALRTLQVACGMNVVVALLGRALSRRIDPQDHPEQVDETESAVDATATGVIDEVLVGNNAARSPSSPGASLSPATARDVRGFVLAASAVVGFVFLLMELVWYRMLSPLLGGSSYTFGLILAVALLGIGLGGLGYTLRGAHRPALLSGFALSCVLEALFLAIPYALGDRVALLALFMRTFGVIGLHGHVVAWTAVTMVVVLPAAFIAGYQFPMLIALLGGGDERVGRHVGLAYAFNTLGAIGGSVLGGFFLIPDLSAPGSWRVAVWLLVALAAWASVLQLRLHASTASRPETRVRAAALLPSLALGVLAIACVQFTLGPTAFWRHSPIGAGRVDSSMHNATRNSLKRDIYHQRRAIRWEIEGRESSIGLFALNGVAFLINGKSDGSAIEDSGTQVMSGLLGALRHPGEVKHALVIGLGTGSTAGWLAELPQLEQVDVVELEPGILRVADTCTAVNRDVLRNNKVNIIIGDAREVLLTTPRKYDVIFSEPSNPYRAGVASLFTKEFYEAVRARLNPQGVFVQWLQGYEIDTLSVRTTYTTLDAVFGSVESWRTETDDLVLINRTKDVPLDLDQLRARVKQEPFASALLSVWRAQTAEDVIARHVASPQLARAIAKMHGQVNTDDRNLLEFSIARALGRDHAFSVDVVQHAAHERGWGAPNFARNGLAELDVAQVEETMFTMPLAKRDVVGTPSVLALDEGQKNRARALEAWVNNEPSKARRFWDAQKSAPKNLTQVMAMADSYAAAGSSEQAQPLIDRLRLEQPIEADAIAGTLAFAEREFHTAWRHLRSAFEAHRSDPWPHPLIMWRGLALLGAIAEVEPSLAGPITALLEKPFAVHSLEDRRHFTVLQIALNHRNGAQCLKALDAYGQWPPWELEFLDARVRCFELVGDPRLPAAQRALREFRDDAGTPFDDGFPPAGATKK